MYTDMMKQAVIMDVSMGASMFETAKARGVHLNTVSKWCREAGVKSFFDRPTRRVSDEYIVETIKLFGVATERQLATHCGYKQNSLAQRLKNMRKKRLIHFMHMNTQSKTAKKYFSEYLNKRVYYIDDKSLKAWIKKTTPKDLSFYERKALTGEFRFLHLD